MYEEFLSVTDFISVIQLLTRRYSDQDDTSNALVQASEQQLPIDRVLRCIIIDFLVIRALKTSFQRVERVHEEIYSQRSSSSSLDSSVRAETMDCIRVDDKSVQRDGTTKSFQISRLTQRLE